MPSNGGRDSGVPGLPSLRAAGPVELRRRNRLEPRNGAPAEKNKARVRQTEIRRTLSLDAILAPYLQGQWPREGERQGHNGHCQKDKFVQPSSRRPEESERSDPGSHKRSASWGNGDHLQDIVKLKQQLHHGPKPGVYAGIRERHLQPLWACSQSQPIPIPLSSLTDLPSTMRQSEERLDQELERAFTHQSPIQLSRLLEIPDGHRAPVPLRSCSSSCQREPSFTMHPSSQLSSSPSASPCYLTELDTDFSGTALQSCPSPLLSSDSDAAVLLSCSPRPNKSYCFQREPPEGCERVRVCEENISLYKDQPNILSCPDPNKVNFTPHGGSAFCPVSLLKPLLPSVDFLFRSLSVSPGSCWAGQAGQSPAVNMTRYMGSLEPATTAI